jgi:hypothetical protein
MYTLFFISISANLLFQDLLEYLISRPTADQLEMRLYIYDEWDLMVSQQTISRVLKGRGWSKKKVAVAAAQRNSQLRDDWVARISQYQPQQLMFLDESAANEKTPSRSTGWSPLNVMPCIQRILKLSEHWSILPAYTLNGYITYELIQGSFDTQRFNNFVHDKVLPLCVPGWTVVCLDNCRTHRNQVSKFNHFCNRPNAQ